MKLHIEHHTDYHYTQPLQHAIQTLHLTPATGPTQQVLQWQLHAPGQLRPAIDAYGNLTHTLTFGDQAIVLNTLHALHAIHAKGTVQTTAIAEFTESGTTSPLIYLRETALTHAHERMRQFAEGSIAKPLTQALNQSLTIASLLQLASRIAQQVRYKSGSTEVNTTAEEAFDLNSGVCQDQAHVLVALCRSQGVPARYVSGYFYAPDAPELASHAWVDVCLDAAAQRWVSIDVTHECLTDERHVRLAVGTDYAACAPVRGVRHGGGEEKMEVMIRITSVGAE